MEKNLIEIQEDKNPNFFGFSFYLIALTTFKISS